MQIPDHFATMFGRNWTFRTGQKTSKLKETVTFEGGCTGEKKSENQIHDVQSIRTTGERFKRIPIRDLETSKRWMTPETFSCPTHESKWDEEFLAPTIAPTGKHTEAHARAYYRDMDDTIISALGGTAYTGATGVTATVLPTTQKVAKDYVHTGAAADSPITVHKIIRALEILTDNDVIDEDPEAMGDMLHGVWTPRTETYLRHLVAANGAGVNFFNKDFLPPVFDARGRIKTWLGINWRISTRPGLTDADDASIDYTYIYVKSGVKLGEWAGMSTTIDRLPQNDNAVQFLSQYAFGATRLEEEKVVQIAGDH